MLLLPLYCYLVIMLLPTLCLFWMLPPWLLAYSFSSLYDFILFLPSSYQRVPWYIHCVVILHICTMTIKYFQSYILIHLLRYISIHLRLSFSFRKMHYMMMIFNSEALDMIRLLHDVTKLVISFSTQVKIICLKDKFTRKWKFSHYLLTTVQCRWKSGEVLLVHKTFLEEKTVSAVFS